MVKQRVMVNSEYFDMRSPVDRSMSLLKLHYILSAHKFLPNYKTFGTILKSCYIFLNNDLVFVRYKKFWKISHALHCCLCYGMVYFHKHIKTLTCYFANSSWPLVRNNLNATLYFRLDFCARNTLHNIYSATMSFHQQTAIHQTSPLFPGPNVFSQSYCMIRSDLWGSDDITSLNETGSANCEHFVLATTLASTTLLSLIPKHIFGMK